MKAKILKPVFVSGEPCKAGDIVEVSKSDLMGLKAMGKAEEAPVVPVDPAPEPELKPARRKAKSKSISKS